MVPPPSSPLTANSVFSPAQTFFSFLFLVLPVSSFSISLSIFIIFFLILLDFSSRLGCYIVSPWAMLLLDSEKSIPHFMVHDVVVTPSLKEVTGHYFTSRMMQKAWKCFFVFLFSFIPCWLMRCCICSRMPPLNNCRNWAMLVPSIMLSMMDSSIKVINQTLKAWI